MESKTGQNRPLMASATAWMNLAGGALFFHTVFVFSQNVMALVPAVVLVAFCSFGPWYFKLAPGSGVESVLMNSIFRAVTALIGLAGIPAVYLAFDSIWTQVMLYFTYVYLMNPASRIEKEEAASHS